MSQPSTAKCYDKIVKDPSLLWLFPEKECTSLWELPLLGALQFRLILERLFAHIATPDMWGKTGVEFITHTGQKISGKATPMVILVTDGVGEGNLGTVTSFCHHNQAKMENSDAISTLHHCDLPQPSVIVVRRYTNTPYIPWGTSCFLYLDVSTLSGCTSSTQFPLDWLHLCRLLPFSKAEVILPCEEGEMGFKMYPHSQEVLWKSSEEEDYLSDPVLLSIPLSTLLAHQEHGTEMEEELGYHPALQQLQDFNQARVHLECELGQEAQKLAQRYNDHMIKLAKKHEMKWARMTQEGNATIQEVFSVMSLTDSIKLLPLCVSSTVPFCYVGEALATTMQQSKNI